MPFLPTAPLAPDVAAQVREAERALLDAEGPYHVAGRYIADALLAARERLREAGYRVREHIRRHGFIARAA